MKEDDNYFRRRRRVTSTRAVSSVITTIILTAILLIILVVASYVATNILDLQMTSTEFEQAKGNMLLLDDIVQDVSMRPGSGGYVQFNQRNGGIGISQQTNNIKLLAYPQQTAVTLKPNGIGTFSEWVLSNTMVPRYNLTNDGDDNTYIMTIDTTSRESQQLDDPPLNIRGLTISYVTFHIKASKNGNGDSFINIRLRTYGTDYENSTAWKLSNSYRDFETVYSKNPSTNSVWTWNEIDNLEIGCRASTVASGARVDVSEFYVIIDTIAPSPSTILNGSSSCTNLVYSGSSRTSAAEIVLRGTSDIKVDLTQGLDFLRVEQDQGVKIKLDYNRIRINLETLLDSNTALVQITMINLTKGNMGGSGTINLKVQDTQITSTPYVLNSSTVTIQAQWNTSTGSYVFDATILSPSVTKTVVMFTKISIQISTA